MTLKLNNLVGFGKGSGGAAGGVDPNPKTLVFCCGFECGRVIASTHVGTLDADHTIQTSVVRSGTYALRNNMTAQTGSTAIGPSVNANNWVAKFYIRFAVLPSANAQLVSVPASGGIGTLGLKFHATGSTLRAGRFNSPNHFEGASGVAVTTGVWYRVDLKISCNGVNAITVDAQVDGVAVGQYSLASASTMSGVASYGVTAAGGLNADFYIDDVSVSHTAADYPLGAAHVHAFVPTADGVHSTGTAGNFKVGAAGANITDITTDSYQLLDEIPIDDTTPDTNDYINCAADTGAGSNYVEHVLGPAPNSTVPTLGPRGVDVVIAYHQAGTGVGDSTFKVNDNGTEDTVLATGAAAGQTTTRYARKHYVNPPSAASVWTTVEGNGNFKNLRTRFGYVADGNPDQYFDGVIAEAEFSDV